MVLTDSAAQVMEWLAENPGPWMVGLLTQEEGKNRRMFWDYTAGFVTFVADTWEDAGDCLAFYRQDGQGQAAFVKAAFGEVNMGENGTLIIFYNNLEVKAPGFLPVAAIGISKL
ncbi:MAG: hypothetical protein H5T99_00470 [Moorella sp. (in: Bacteria)]|nr:hypothetical protein [Moorella sp. (in: firmicutes)]